MNIGDLNWTIRNKLIDKHADLRPLKNVNLFSKTLDF